jgi:uncharacterized protein DUF5681
MKRDSRFKPGQSGNPGGRPKGSKTYAIRELIAQALADPATRAAAVAEFRKALSRGKSVIPAVEFAAKVNREIGQGSGETPGGVTIVINAAFSPSKLAAARDRALPVEPSQHELQSDRCGRDL